MHRLSAVVTASVARAHRASLALVPPALFACANLACQNSTGTRTGYVDIIAFYSGNSYAGSAIALGFNASPAAPGPPQGCPSQTIGACQVMTCAPADSEAAAAMTTLASAGTITLSDPMGQIVLPFTDAGYETPGELTGLNAGPLSPGSEIAVVAEGGEVPAFSGTIVVPQAIVLTSPPVLAMYIADPLSAYENEEPPVPIVRSSDLVLEWEGGSGAVVFVIDSPGVQITCTTPASAAQLVVPTSALAYLSADAGNAFVDLFCQNVTTVTLPGWIISLEAQAQIAESSPSPASGGTVTVQ